MRRFPVVLGLALAALVPPPAGAATSCGAVAGTTVVSTPSLRIVARHTPATQARERVRTFHACHRSSGTVRRLGYSGGRDTGRTSSAPLEGRFAINRTAGRFVLFRQFTQDNEAGSQLDRRLVLDVRSGARREVWRFSYLESTLCDEEGGPGLPPPRRFALGPNGIVAGIHAARSDDALRECYSPSDAAVVVASVPGGSGLRELDRGPIGTIPFPSLALQGRTVSWTHSGEARSVTL